MMKLVLIFFALIKFNFKKAIENWTLLKKEFETLLGEDNMLNRLGEFGIDLLKTGFSAVESNRSYYVIYINYIEYRNRSNNENHKYHCKCDRI